MYVLVLVYLTIVAIVSMLGYIQWLMDYLVFIVRELLLVAKDLRQKHYDSMSSVGISNGQGKPMYPAWRP